MKIKKNFILIINGKLILMLYQILWVLDINNLLVIIKDLHLLYVEKNQIMFHKMIDIYLN